MKGLVVTPAYFPDKSKGGSITGCRSFAKAISLIHQLEIGTLDTTNEGERVLEVDEIKVSYFQGIPSLKSYLNLVFLGIK